MKGRMLTPFVARKPKAEIGSEMESFHIMVESICEAVWDCAFPEDGASYRFKDTMAWTWPKEQTRGIPIAVTLN